MNLIVDIGNTAAKACVSEGQTLGRTYRYQGEKVVDFIVDVALREHPKVLVISSVYAISASDQKTLRSACGRLLILDNAHTDTLRQYSLPNYLSYDRAAAIIASRKMFSGKGITLADFGTTLTVDFIRPDGSYEGGNIALGLRTRLKAINRYTKALPLIETPSDPSPIGGDFPSSIASGVVTGMVFEMRGYLDYRPDNVIVFTGGDAKFFEKQIKSPTFAICNLVLMGLALIADDYVEKNIQ